jgi:hypothetical protein
LTRPLDEFAAAGTWSQRTGLKALLSLARRPRGRALIRRVGPIDQIAQALLAMEYFDAPAVARELGWDAAAVVARGRELRQAEGRL